MDARQLLPLSRGAALRSRRTASLPPLVPHWALTAGLALVLSFAAASAADANPRPQPIEFVPIPSGDFLMGADLSPDLITGEKGVFIQDEFPTRRVTLSRGFALSKHEVTNQEYEEFDPAHRSWRGQAPGISTKDRAAVVFVTWNDAVSFCRWRSGLDSQHDYRLPTEAE